MVDDYEEFRVFVGGLSWDTTDRTLENAFRRFGKVVEAKVMLDRDTGRPRGFGFVTFSDKRGMEEAIDQLHDRELDGRLISVTKAQPKGLMGGGDYGYRGGYGNVGRSRGGYGGRGGGGREDCFKCGQPGHWARECPSGGGGGGRFSRDRYGGARSDRYGGGDFGYGARYGSRDHGGDRDKGVYSRDRGSDRYNDGYGRDGRSGGYGDRDGSRSSDRYGSGGPTRYEGSYKERFGPYNRASGGRSSYDDRY